MRTMNRLAAATAAAAALVTVGTSSSVAHASTDHRVTTHIVGGTSGSSPYIVQLIFRQGFFSYGCTGEAINSEWVLTAKHCVAGISAMNVYYSNSVTNRGTAIAADKVVAAPSGDVGLVHLSTPKTLSSYGALTSGYTPKSGDSGVIWGYGATANGGAATHLNKATVKVTGASTDNYRGAAIHVVGVNGAANHGDSGGPLIVGGKIVGVCSTGDTSDPGADIHAGSNYANLTPVRSWIKATAGV